MRNMKVSTPEGGTKKVRVSRVGQVLWNGATEELTITGEESYLKVTKAVASMMLVTDQVVNLAVARADVYPMYGNPNAVQVLMTVVSVNAGESRVHDPEQVRPHLEALGRMATDYGFFDSPFLKVEDGGQADGSEE